MFLFAVVLLVFGLPFVGYMSAARSLSQTRRPVVAEAVGAAAFFAIATSALLVLGHRIGLGRPQPWITTALLGGSVGAAWTVWHLTRRLGHTLLVFPIAIAAGGVFIWIESRTHGPWYIQSELVAYFVSLLGAATFWHSAMAVSLLIWARGSGRRESRIRDGRCWNCGYHLVGLHTKVCPECGRPIF